MAGEFLRVRAELRTPVVADAWLPLDGILFYQAVRDDLGAQEMTTPGVSLLAQPKGEVMKGGRLPVAIVHARDWYYRCSWAQWGPYVDGQDYWAKRFDMSHAELVDFGGKRGKIDLSSGTYKAYRMPVFYRAALWVEWYIVGDLEAIRYLLACVTHVGKKTSQGWGRVRNWVVEPAAEDWSVWREGKLMRGIPIYHWPRDLGEARKLGIYGIRPSYWDKRNQMELVMP